METHKLNQEEKNFASILRSKKPLFATRKIEHGKLKKFSLFVMEEKLGSEVGSVFII